MGGAEAQQPCLFGPANKPANGGVQSFRNRDWVTLYAH